MGAWEYEFYLLVLKVSLASERSERVRETFSTRCEDKIRIPKRPCNILYLSSQNPGINFPYFQLAKHSIRFPSQLISQCNFSQIAQILHEERVFCRAAPLGTPKNNRRLYIVQKVTRKSNDATQFAKLDS